jgi:NADPH:quinone reductase
MQLRRHRSHANARGDYTIHIPHVIPRYDAISGVREFESLNRPVETAKLKVPIAEAFALVNVAKVHRRLAEGHAVGKVMLGIHQS